MGKPVNRHKWPNGLGGRSFPPAEVRGAILPKASAEHRVEEPSLKTAFSEIRKPVHKLSALFEEVNFFSLISLTRRESISERLYGWRGVGASEVMSGREPAMEIWWQTPRG